jgi:hypothetical protein
VTRVAAVVLSVLDILLMALAITVVLATEDADTILLGDAIAAAACLLAVPLMHYWIEGGGRRG